MNMLKLHNYDEMLIGLQALIFIGNTKFHLIIHSTTLLP